MHPSTIDNHLIRIQIFYIEAAEACDTHGKVEYSLKLYKLY